MASRSKWGKHDDRIAWLLKHPEAWQGAPSMAQDVTDAGRAQLNQLCEAMTTAGLFGPHTNEAAQRDSVRLAIGKARRLLERPTA